jgi:UDP:flavonoid glycosyltransferase YjiC (YdhE family)
VTRFALFNAQSSSHLGFLLPLAEELARSGHEVHVFTEAVLREEVEQAGLWFHDLYEGRPVEAVDDTSTPVPIRDVAHAGQHGQTIAEEVRALRPEVVVHEMFATIGLVVARTLDLPVVSVLTAHSGVPARVLADIRANRRVEVSPAAEAAVARLRDVHGIAGAHPLLYSDALSLTLNLYPEPIEHLPEDDRTALAPVDYLGCVAPRLRSVGATSPFSSSGRRRVLAAFGTIVWRYYEAEAADALRAVAACCERDGDELVVGLGGFAPSGNLVEDLSDHGATVVPQVDQWGALAHADAFVTHHGLKSTHEAIYHGTPMLSYPFFGDQPLGAARCRQLGLAVPLASAPRAPITIDDVAASFALLDTRSEEVHASLEEARRWEQRTIDDRPRLAARVADLAR